MVNMLLWFWHSRVLGSIICPFPCIIFHPFIIKCYKKLDDLHHILVVAMELNCASLRLVNQLRQ